MLRSKKEATFEEIKYHLETQSEITGHDLNISKRTFYRDLSDILSVFNILIEFNLNRKVYYINDDEQIEINNTMMEAFNIFNALSMSDNLKPYIVFEKRRPLGTEHFYVLLHAIQNNLIIRFTYTKYWNDEVSERSLEPYMLKESRYRWYLIAKDLKDNKIKTFGLDRISNLEITKKKYSKSNNNNPNDIYKDCYGILTKQGLEPEEVILSFTPFQGKYIKSLPLHASQVIIAESEKEIRVKLKIHITEDFLKELFSFGDEMIIIEPKSLRKKICSIFENAIIKNQK